MNNMKKILCLSIVLCFILNAFCFTAFAADVFDATLIYDSVNQTISVSGIKTGGNTQIVYVKDYTEFEVLRKNKR